MRTQRYLAVFFLFIVLLHSTSLAGRRRHVVPDDLRNIVTDVNQTAHTITVTSMRNKIDTVFTMADPKFYPNDIFIDGEPKKFSDIVRGLQYMTSVEVSHDVVESISLRTADSPPR